MINIGVLGSTNGTDLKAVLDAVDNKVIDASVNIVDLHALICIRYI